MKIIQTYEARVPVERSGFGNREFFIAAISVVIGLGIAVAAIYTTGEKSSDESHHDISITATDAPNYATKPWKVRGTVQTSVESWIGCRDRAIAARIVDLVDAHDAVAAARLAGMSACIPIPRDTQFLVEDYTSWPVYLCLRPDGDPFCYWTPDFIVGLNMEP